MGIHFLEKTGPYAAISPRTFRVRVETLVLCECDRDSADV